MTVGRMGGCTRSQAQDRAQQLRKLLLTQGESSYEGIRILQVGEHELSGLGQSREAYLVGAAAVVVVVVVVVVLPGVAAASKACSAVSISGEWDKLTSEAPTRRGEQSSIFLFQESAEPSE